MLPKKRKFDLSKFELDRGDGNSGTGGAGPSSDRSGVTVTVTSTNNARQPQPPTADLHTLPVGLGPPILPISPAKGVPASGFLTPETVHEAFAGNSFLKSVSARDHGRLLVPSTRSGYRPSPSPLTNNIVDLSVSQKPDKSPHSVSVSFTTSDSQYSAFSRPSSRPAHSPHGPAPSPSRLKPQHYDATQSFKRVRQPSDSGVSVVLEPSSSLSSSSSSSHNKHSSPGHSIHMSNQRSKSATSAHLPR